MWKYGPEITKELKLRISQYVNKFNPRLLLFQGARSTSLVNPGRRKCAAESFGFPLGRRHLRPRLRGMQTLVKGIRVQSGLLASLVAHVICQSMLSISKALSF